jgi:hypothetical protein
VSKDRETYKKEVMQSHLDSQRPLLIDTHVNETAWSTPSETLSFSAELSLASNGLPDLGKWILDILQWILILLLLLVTLLGVALELLEKAAHGSDRLSTRRFV